MRLPALAVWKNTAPWGYSLDRSSLKMAGRSRLDEGVLSYLGSNVPIYFQND
jgi:hypothetical protein